MKKRYRVVGDTLQSFIVYVEVDETHATELDDATLVSAVQQELRTDHRHAGHSEIQIAFVEEE